MHLCSVLALGHLSSVTVAWCGSWRCVCVSPSPPCLLGGVHARKHALALHSRMWQGCVAYMHARIQELALVHARACVRACVHKPRLMPRVHVRICGRAYDGCGLEYMLTPAELAQAILLGTATI